MEAGPDLSLQLRLPSSCEPTTTDQQLGWPSTELRLFPIPAESNSGSTLFIRGVPVYQSRTFPFPGGNETASSETTPICSFSGRLVETGLHRDSGSFSQRREAPAMTSWFSPGLRRTPAASEMFFRHHHNRCPVEVAAMMRRSFGKRSTRAPRMRWTSALHARFIHAVDLLGGHERATPKSVLELMDCKDLTLAHVKSHLQMYRTIKTTEKASVFTGHFHQDSQQARLISNKKDQNRKTENIESTKHSQSSSRTGMETSLSEVEDPQEQSQQFGHSSKSPIADSGEENVIKNNL